MGSPGGSRLITTVVSDAKSIAPPSASRAGSGTAAPSWSLTTTTMPTAATRAPATPRRVNRSSPIVAAMASVTSGVSANTIAPIDADEPLTPT